MQDLGLAVEKRAGVGRESLSDQVSQGPGRWSRRVMASHFPGSFALREKTPGVLV